MLRKIISLIIILFISSAISAAQDESLQKYNQPSSGSYQQIPGIPKEIQDKSDKFFQRLIRNEIEIAFDEFLKDSPIRGKKDQLKNLVDQTKKSYELYGKMVAYESVSSETVTPSFIKMRFLALHTKYPMRWIISYYKSPDSGWIIINIKFDDLAEYYFSDE